VRRRKAAHAGAHHRHSHPGCLAALAQYYQPPNLQEPGAVRSVMGFVGLCCGWGVGQPACRTGLYGSARDRTMGSHEQQLPASVTVQSRYDIDVVCCYLLLRGLFRFRNGQESCQRC
jgi:hypothetical protein